jgi:hypothetical protein
VAVQVFVAACMTVTISASIEPPEAV